VSALREVLKHHRDVIGLCGGWTERPDRGVWRRSIVRLQCRQDRPESRDPDPHPGL